MVCKQFKINFRKTSQYGSGIQKNKINRPNKVISEKLVSMEVVFWFGFTVISVMVHFRKTSQYGRSKSWSISIYNSISIISEKLVSMEVSRSKITQWFFLQTISEKLVSMEVSIAENTPVSINPDFRKTSQYGRPQDK